MSLLGTILKFEVVLCQLWGCLIALEAEIVANFLKCDL